MKGNPEVIDVLGEVLCAELTAINQYFIHAKMCADWGYHALATYGRAESIDEMKHAEIVIERILFLEGVPNMQKYMKVKVGKTVPEQFQNDVELEYGAVERLNRGIAICVEKKDNTTRELLETILAEEEHHIDWLETQLHLVKTIGVERYLSMKLGEEKAGH
ncbi:MAG: bacterioferritin [Planctomycetaceae bacterium]